MKRNIRAIMSFRVFTPIFLIKVPLLREWMDERASDGCGENRRHTWVDGGGSNTNEQHPLIYHICSFFLCHASGTPFLHSLTQRARECTTYVPMQKVGDSSGTNYIIIIIILHLSRIMMTMTLTGYDLWIIRDWNAYALSG